MLDVICALIQQRAGEQSVNALEMLWECSGNAAPLALCPSPRPAPELGGWSVKKGKRREEKGRREVGDETFMDC